MRYSKQTTRTLAVTGTFISYFVAVFFVAKLAVTAAAAPHTFNDPTITDFDGFGTSVVLALAAQSATTSGGGPVAKGVPVCWLLKEFGHDDRLRRYYPRSGTQ